MARTDGSPARENDRASRLRTLHRLRAGLPPAEHLDELTSGGKQILGCASRLLAPEAGGARWMQVIGDYGEGKSYALTMLRELAQRQGFATCWLSGDGGSSALNHPQRFLPVMLSTLEVSGMAVSGYEDLLYEMMREGAGTKRLREIVGRHLHAHQAAITVWWHLGRLLELQQQLLANTIQDERGASADAVVLHLSGQSIRHGPASPRSRELAYTLLRIAAEVVLHLGKRGIVLLVDEVESVYTKLPNVRSRRGAYRVLATVCESPSLELCRVVLAVTPDARRAILNDIPYMLDSLVTQAGEPVSQWAARLSGDSLITVACQRPEGAAREQLLNELREFYLLTYTKLREQFCDSRWGDFVRDMVTRRMPLRLIVREAIGFLDTQRYLGRDVQLP